MKVERQKRFIKYFYIFLFLNQKLSIFSLFNSILSLIILPNQDCESSVILLVLHLSLAQEALSTIYMYIYIYILVVTGFQKPLNS